MKNSPFDNWYRWAARAVVVALLGVSFTTSASPAVPAISTAMKAAYAERVNFAAELPSGPIRLIVTYADGAAERQSLSSAD